VPTDDKVSCLLLIDRILEPGSSELQCSRLAADSNVTSSGHAQYSVDSVERYFRSLREAAAADESVANNSDTNTASNTTSSRPTHTSSTDDDDAADRCHGYGAALKQSFRAHVDSVKRSLLQSTDDLFFTRHTSNVTSHDLDPCEGHDLDELKVRDSEDFVYEDSEERKRVALASVPDALRRQLVVDLAESMDNVTVSRKQSMNCGNEAAVMTSDHPARSHSRPVTSHMADSLTFDYVDLSVGDGCLSEDLRQELRLDLRDSTDDLHAQGCNLTAPDEHTDTASASAAGHVTTTGDVTAPVVSLPPLIETTGDGVDEIAVDCSRDNSCTDAHNVFTPGVNCQRPNTSCQHQLTRHQSSDMYSKSRVPGGDVLKPVPSRTRPQTATAATGSCVNASKKKTVAWSRDVTTTQGVNDSSSNKPRRPTTAHVTAGRHGSSVLANQRPASSSADQQNSRERYVSYLSQTKKYHG